MPYTSADLNYNTDCRANREQNDANARPAIANTVENMEQYDTMFLGYPIWQGQAPKIIYTFLEKYNFSGKTIVPFCSMGGGHFGQTISAIAKLALNSTIKDGLEVSYSSYDRAKIQAWLMENGIPAK